MLGGKLQDTMLGLVFVVLGAAFARPWPKALALCVFGVGWAAMGHWRAPEARERRRLRLEEQRKRAG